MINGEKNRIAMFSVHSDPLAAIGSRSAGGQNVYIKNLVTHLDKKGWGIDVFTRLDNAKKKIISKIGKRSRVIRLSAGKPIDIPKGQLHPHFTEFYQNFLQFISSAEAVPSSAATPVPPSVVQAPQNPYQLFHGHHYDGGEIALWAHQQFKKPLVVNFHSLGQVRFETQKKYSFDGNEQKIFDERFVMEKDIVKNASLIISLAETEKRDLHMLYGAASEKVVVIPGGVNISEFMKIPKEKARASLNLPMSDFILLFVGRLEWRKGVGTLISALELLKKEIPNVRLRVVGGKIFGLQKNKDDFREYQRLSEKAREDKVEESIEFMGRIDQGQLRLCYSAADVLVIPSYYEPFGLVALEGMAAQIPVVASRKGGLRYTIKENQNGLLFEPRNARDLKEKIFKLYKSKELTSKLVGDAYEDVVKNYSWKHIAEQISAAYNNFIH